MPSKTNTKGFSLPIVLAVVAIIAAILFGGYFVWQRNKEKEPTQKKTNTSSKAEKQEDEPAKDETADWVSATTQGGAFSMRVPDGWSMTNYPNDFLGTTGVTYKAGTTATVESSDTEYRGHSLRFRASVTALDDTGLGPQWSSPQPGLTETTEDFSIGSLTGKRYKGDFTGDLNQTLYEYVFDLGNSKKLDIVYTVNHASGDVDGVATVEKAIKTIHLNN